MSTYARSLRQWLIPTCTCVCACACSGNGYNAVVFSGRAEFTTYGSGTDFCPMVCKFVDQFLVNISNVDRDCLDVPFGYYSRANDNRMYPCTYADGLPPQLQIFTSRGGGLDNCSISPRLQAYIEAPLDSAITSPLIAPATIETWVKWGSTPSTTQVALVGVTSRWLLSLGLHSPSGTIRAVLLDVVRARSAPAIAQRPQISSNEWHHIAAVIAPSDISTCYYLDGIGIGCGAFANVSGLQTIHRDPVTFFIGGANGMSTAGFPPGFLHGSMDEVRMHQRALPVNELGFHQQTDYKLGLTCSHGNQVCGGKCVSSCLGGTWLNHSTCLCSCPDPSMRFDIVLGKCRPACSGTMTHIAQELCSCPVSEYKVWRGRYFGISSRGMANLSNNSQCGADGGIGLAEVRLFDSQLEQLTTPRSCTEYVNGTALVRNSKNNCSALFDDTTIQAMGNHFQSAQAQMMRVVLDLGAIIDVSRAELYHYDEAGPNCHGVKSLDIYFHSGNADGAPPSEIELFDPRYQIIKNGAIGNTNNSRASAATIFDDRAATNPLSGGLSCAACPNNTTGSIWPRTSIRSCMCQGTHYKEPFSMLGRCIPRLMALPPPHGSLLSGVVSHGAELQLYANGVAANLGDASIRYTLTSQPSRAPSGVAPTEQSPAFDTPLRLSTPAHFYKLRAIQTHPKHLPSEEYAAIFHTRVKLLVAAVHPSGGLSTIYPLSVTINATIPSLEHLQDTSGVVLRYTTDTSNVTASSSVFPTMGLKLTSNTSLRTRAFHPLYFESDETNSFFYVSPPPRSFPKFPVALQTDEVRTVPVGTQIQIGQTGDSDAALYYAMLPSPQPDCTSIGSWMVYSSSIILTLPSDVTICAITRENGYQPSAAAQAYIRVQKRAKPVKIVQSNLSAIPPPVHTGGLEWTMSSEGGATIWYAYELPAANWSICQAHIQAASIASNLTLAADGQWQDAIDMHTIARAPCVGVKAALCKRQALNCWCAAHTMP